MKTLLHIGCNVGTESFPKYFREQCRYDELFLYKDIGLRLRDIILSGKRPDIIFLQIQSDTIEGVSTVSLIGQEIRKLKEMGSFVINWTGDIRASTPQWMIDFAPSVNITLFSNHKDIETFRTKGLNTEFLQCGIDTNIFTHLGHSSDSTPSIVFLANNYGNHFPLSGYRKDAVNILRSKFGHRFKVYGNGWGADSGNVNANQREEAEVYRGAKIAISISHFDSPGYFSDRLGRAMCSGVFVLSHRYKSIEKDFNVGDHLDVFDDLNHMVNLCNYYLEQDELREDIAECGRQYAHQEFSYQNIVDQILNFSNI